MITEIQNFRQKYPEYDDLDDVTLATKLASKDPEYEDLPSKVKSESGLMKDVVPADPRETISQGPPKWTEPVKTGFETLGLLGGGAIGGLSAPVAGPFTPAVSAATAGAGYALGKKAYGGLMDLLGIRTSPFTKKPQTPLESMGTTGKDILEGATIQSGGDVAGNVLGKVITTGKQLLQAPFGKATSSPESTELARIYKEFNIPASPSDLLPHSKTLSILEGVAGYRPGSGDVMLKKASEKIDALNKAREVLIDKQAPADTVEVIGGRIKKEAEGILEKYTGAKGQKLSQLVDDFTGQVGTKGKYEAGQTFSQIMQGDRQSRGESVRNLYSTVRELLPQKGKDIVELSPETISMVDRLLQQETSKIPPLQNKDVVRILQSLKKTNKTELPEGVSSIMLEKDPQLKAMVTEEYGPKTTWEGLQQNRSELLEKIRLIKQTQRQPTNETRIYSELTDALDQDMGRYAETQGGDIWASYKAASGEAKKMHELYDKDILRIMDKSPEDILKSVVNSGEVTLLRQIKNAVGEQGIVPMRQGFFKQMIDASTINGIINTKKLGANLSRLGEETLSELSTPTQRQMLQKIIKTGESITHKMGTMKTVEFLETLSGTSNEKIVNAIIKPNNTYNVRLAKKLLEPERFKEIESASLEKMFIMSGTGNYLPVSSVKAWRQYDAPMKELLSPEKYRAVTDFLKGGINMTKVEALAKNASQTGQVLLGSQIGSQIMKNPLVTGKLVVLPWMLAKIYTNPTATAWMTKALKVEPTSPIAISHFIKALSVIGVNLSEQPERGNQPERPVPPPVQVQPPVTPQSQPAPSPSQPSRVMNGKSYFFIDGKWKEE